MIITSFTNPNCSLKVERNCCSVHVGDSPPTNTRLLMMDDEDIDGDGDDDALLNASTTR